MIREHYIFIIVRCLSGDGKILQAGHLEKFRSFVLIDHSGQNEWFSPATFKSTCNLNVKFFPFDKQDCRMVFRSLTADESFMEIRTKNTESDDPEEGKEKTLYLLLQRFARLQKKFIKQFSVSYQVYFLE